MFKFLLKPKAKALDSMSGILESKALALETTSYRVIAFNTLIINNLNEIK